MWYVIGFTVLALAVVLAPVVLEWLRAPVDASDRKGADGDFADLSQGMTYYRWVGPVRGPVAVVIHGLTTPSVGMEPLAEGLGGMGYRVLMYDLYGRGLSDAPRGRQDRQFFLRQLDDLIADQGLGEDLTLVGYSMGAAIATAFAADNPHRVKRVIMIAGAGIMMNETGFVRFCRRVPVLGDWLHGILGGRHIRKAIPDRARRPEISRVLMAQRQELRRRGYLPAVLSSRRGMLSDTQESEHRKLGLEDVPVVAIWAQMDEVIPVVASSELSQWNRAARQNVVEDATHALPYTHSAALLDAIRTVLRD